MDFDQYKALIIIFTNSCEAPYEDCALPLQLKLINLYCSEELKFKDADLLSSYKHLLSNKYLNLWYTIAWNYLNLWTGLLTEAKQIQTSWQMKISHQYPPLNTKKITLNLNLWHLMVTSESFLVLKIYKHCAFFVIYLNF
jgi:hypothetical protein